MVGGGVATPSDQRFTEQCLSRNNIRASTDDRCCTRKAPHSAFRVEVPGSPCIPAAHPRQWKARHLRCRPSHPEGLASHAENHRGASTRSRLAAVGGQARAASPAQPDTPTVVQATDTKRGVHTGSTSGAPCAVRRAPGNLVVTSDVALPRRPPGCPGTAGGGYGLPTITISIEVSVHGVRARSSANLSSAVDGCHRLLAWSCSRASTSRVRTASTPDRPAPRRR